MSAEWNDATMDAIALVELAGSGDEAGARAVLANCDLGAVAACLARLLAAVLAENERGIAVCCPEPGCFREWALSAGRPR